jgi:hypothetical protein
MASGEKWSGAEEAATRPHGSMLLLHFKAVGGDTLQRLSIQGEGRGGTKEPRRCFLAWWRSSSGIRAAWQRWRDGKQVVAGFGALKGGHRGFFYRGRVWHVEGRLIHRIYLVVDPQIVDFWFGFAKGRIWFRLGLKTNSRLESDSMMTGTWSTTQGVHGGAMRA